MNKELRDDTGVNRRHRIIRVTCIVLCAIFGVIILCNLIGTVSNWIRPDMPPSLFGFTSLVVNTDSMSGNEDGCIDAGSLVVARRMSMSEYRKGDVIAFCEDRQTMIGRVTAIKTDETGQIYFHVKADQLEAIYRDCATEENIVGKIWLRVNLLGKAVNFMDTWAGIILLEGLPWLICVGMIGYEVARIVKARKKGTEEDISNQNR